VLAALSGILPRKGCTIAQTDIYLSLVTGKIWYIEKEEFACIP
jgi:hypothetical protein